MAGNADEPATLTIVAAGDILISKAVNLKGSDTNADGGEFTVSSTLGSVHISDDVFVAGGGESAGGTVNVDAAVDVTIDALIDASGGSFDGGTIEIDAGRDYIQNGELVVDATGGDGVGGDVSLNAGRDVILTPGTTSNRRRISAGGNTSRDLEGGDGGTIEVVAGRDVNFGSVSRLEADGADPDAEGGEISVVAGRDASLGGELRSRSRGIRGGGDFITVAAQGRVDIPASGTIDVTGGSRGGGTLQIDVAGPFSNFGPIDVSGGNGGAGGHVSVESGDVALLEGSMVVAGVRGEGTDNLLMVKACLVEMRIGGLLDNRAERGENRLVGRESVILRLNAELRATENGTNNIVYGDPGEVPIILGIVSPKAVETVDESLERCPVCGNEEIEEGEFCDDGNLEEGDGCSADCLPANCIDDTPGFPAVDLCDDADACTLDICDLKEGCLHPAACDDGVDCTIDSCDAGVCEFLPDDNACDDGDVCTDDACSPTEDCASTDNDAPCDDGLFCTVDDTCSNGVCVGTPRVCDDGIDCTIDSCNETINLCEGAAEDSLCSDGAFCNGSETCDAMSGCVAGTAPDCSGLDGVCTAGACDEDADQCAADPANEDGACDDGDECTAEDACSDGVCVGVAIPGCGVVCGDGDVDEGDVDEGEDCDDGDTDFNAGEACSATCSTIPCGHPTGSTGQRPSATDALFILKVSVGQGTCSLAVCDTDGSGAIRATDALRTLGAAVGRNTPLVCPVEV
jgi:cysteine-rich repeat protein